MKLSHQIGPPPSGTLDVTTQKFVTDTVSTPLSSGMELVDKITLTANAQNVTFSATGDGQFKHDVNGNTDERYILICRILNNSGGGPTYTLKPNNLTTNQQTESVAVSGGVVTGTVTSDILFISTASTSLFINSDIQAKTGFERLIHSRTVASAAGDDLQRMSGSVWNDTSTNITSLVISSSLANGLGTNSVFELYRIRALRPVVLTKAIGSLEFLDRIEVTANTTSVTFGATGNGQLLRALDGDVDEEYVCRYRFVKNGNPVYSLQPNGIATGQSFEAVVSAGGVASASALTELRITGASVGAEEYHGEFRLHAKTGRPRRFKTADTGIDTSSFDVSFYVNGGGAWSDTSTNVTSLVIASSLASGIGIGSTFELYRVTSKTVRADSAASYERLVTALVDPGALATTEQTTGAIAFGGSLLGFSARLEDAVTAGTIAVNVKVNGVTKLTDTLSTTQTTFIRAAAGVGTYPVVAGDNVSVEIVPTSYTNSGSVVSGITVNVMFINSSLTQPPVIQTVTAVKTSAYTANFWETVLVNPSAGSFVVTLPNVNPHDIGSAVEVHIDANTSNQITVDGDGSDTIAGVSDFSFAGPYTTAVFRAITTSKWIVI